MRKRFFRHRGALVAMVALAFIVILAFTSVGPQFGSWKPGGWWQHTWSVAVDIENGGRPTLSLFPFSIGNHPFGQDEVGRDIFAVVMRGTQQSLTIMAIIGTHRDLHRHGRRRRLRLLSRLGRLRAHALHRHHHHHPGDRHRRGARSPLRHPGRAGARDHPRPRAVDRSGAAGSRRVPLAARAGVRRCRAGRGGQGSAHHLPPHPAERDRRDHRQLDAADGLGDPDRDRR